MDTKDLLIIGVGNPERGDDGAGATAVRTLDSFVQTYIGAKDIGLAENWGEATTLVSEMEGWQTVIIVDAAVSGADPGTYQRFEANDGALPSDLAEMSSHGFGVAQAIELARALGTLPKRCVVYAIEGTSFEAGDDLSPEVADAAKTVVADIIQTFIVTRPQMNDEQRHA